jgi:hypothetical protein
VRRRFALALAVVAVPAALTVNAQASSTPSARAATTARVGHFVPALGANAATRNATVSLNWAGWVVQPGRPITGVQANFIVPKAKLTPPGFSASWAGIGGYNTKDLIQAGTTSDSVGGIAPRYYAWFEILPDSERLLINCTGDRNCTVLPGNLMGIDIHLVGTNLWSVTVVNSRHWSWHANVSYKSSLSSAEWIIEAPTVGTQTTIADVGSAYFGKISNFTTGGVRHPISSGHPVKINLAGFEARPSGLARNGQSFRVCTYAVRCAAPPA